VVVNTRRARQRSYGLGELSTEAKCEEMEGAHRVVVGPRLAKLAERCEEVVRNGGHRILRTGGLERGLLQRGFGRVVVYARVRVTATMVHVIPEAVHA